MSWPRDVEFARGKLTRTLRLLEHLRASEFPYSEPISALKELEALYRVEEMRLNAVNGSTKDTIRQQACAQVGAKIAQYHHILGFILRATNVRTAFEVYSPFLDICKALYGPEARLIYSSEWEYSPFTYPVFTNDLPNLILIGLPASESDNSLIIPLAGHELGHALWQKPVPQISALGTELETILEAEYARNWIQFTQALRVPTNKKSTDLRNDLELLSYFNFSLALALRQTEELFCDTVGLRLFGESFCYSFTYFLSPHLGETATYYPQLSARVDLLKAASVAFSIDSVAEIDTFFINVPRKLSSAEAFLVRMADNAARGMFSLLIQSVDAMFSASSVALPTNSERDRIVDSFSLLCPPEAVVSLGDIVNAGWRMHFDKRPWHSFSYDPDTAATVLNDLVFKTMEVMEYSVRTR